ncbi:hypothetical protein GQ457_14G026100 [Hibiscus cannabinus]
MTQPDSTRSPDDCSMVQPEAARSSAIDSSTKVHKAFTNKKVNIILDEYNFLMWKQQVLLVVRSLRLEKLLTGALKAPPATITSADGAVSDNEDYEIFVAQDSALASWLLSTISPHLLPQFVGAETASEIWSTVIQFFSSRSTTTIMSLHYKLRSLQKGNLNMRAYVSQVKELSNALAACGSPISDLEVIATILKGLPIEYQPFVAVITANREPFTLDAAVSVLFDVETQLTSFASLSDFSPSLHMAQAATANTSTPLSGGSGVARPYRTSVTARNKDPVKAESNMVNLCTLDSGSPGHICACVGTNNPGIGASSTPVQPQVHSTISKGQWFVDSGASHHVSPDSSKLVDGVEYSGPGKLIVGNGMHIGISRIGQSSLLSTSSRTLRLNNVLHVPSITKNLVSVSKLARDNNVFLEFHARSCVVRDEGTGAVLLTGDEVDGLYSFDLFPIPVVPGVERLWHNDSGTATNGLQVRVSPTADHSSDVVADIAGPNSSVVPRSTCQASCRPSQTSTGRVSPTLPPQSQLLSDKQQPSLGNSSPATLLPQLSPPFLPPCEVGMDHFNNDVTDVDSMVESPIVVKDVTLGIKPMHIFCNWHVFYSIESVKICLAFPVNHGFQHSKNI